MSIETFRREQVIELNVDQLARLRRIWTSDSCPRRQYHRIIGEIPELPAHYLSFKGSAVHRIIETQLSGEDAHIDWDEFPDHEKDIRAEAESHMTKFNRWMESTDIDLSEAEMEVKYEIDLPLGYVKVRKIDVITPTHQIDWKTGIKRNTMDYRKDLAAGHEAVKQSGEGSYPHENLILVFTSGPEAEELAPFAPDKKGKATPFEEAWDEMKREEEANIFHREQIKAGEVPPCKVEFTCVFCGHRHICRGV